MKSLIAAAMLLALTSSAHAAQKWYMTVDIYIHSNHGYTEWGDPQRMYLSHAFSNRGECLARARTFRKQCVGLIANNREGGAGVTKFIPYCRQRSQQPEPVLQPFDASIFPSIDPALEKALEEEKACAR